MKKNVLLSITISAIFAACNFSKGVNTDLTTGLTTTNNGLSINKVFLTDKDNNELSSNIVALGSVIQVVVTEVENFTEQNGKVYPCCTILLKNKNGKEIINIPDAYADLKDGASVEDAKTLTANVNTGKPMVVGEDYDVNIRFFDKKNKANEIIATVNLKMK